MSRTHLKTRTAPRAFTLIEAVISLVILSVAVPAMLWAVRDAVTKRSDPVLASRARWLAAERLEDIIADRHSPSRGYAYVITSNYAAESSVSGFTNFSRSVTISETAANLSSAGTGYKTVTVTVSYLNSRGQSRSYPLATVLTDYTP
jgi:Tfp pilus assembly protein PilV